ncbi:hypothetical protein D1007_18411 [Hordeum vulgare]|nr:hypothetical protein D1007_18411 [Hordeum vulgare]
MGLGLWMGRTCVYVHHMDKDTFLKGNIDPDPDEFDMVFDFCPSYAELLEQVRKDLNWMDPSDVDEFDGRHNVGFGMHIRWKTMHVNSEQPWLAYKDTVAESLDKALELFAIKINVPNLHLDLNRVASPIGEASPPRINEEANIKPLSAQQSSIQHEPLLRRMMSMMMMRMMILFSMTTTLVNWANIICKRQWTILFRTHMAVHPSRTMRVPMKNLMRKGSRQRRLKLSYGIRAVSPDTIVRGS